MNSDLLLSGRGGDRYLAGVDEHREAAESGADALAVEGADDFGRHAGSDVDDHVAGGVDDQIEAQSGAVDLAVDLRLAVQALLEITEDRRFIESAEAVA